MPKREDERWANTHPAACTCVDCDQRRRLRLAEEERRRIENAARRRNEQRQRNEDVTRRTRETRQRNEQRRRNRPASKHPALIAQRRSRDAKLLISLLLSFALSVGLAVVLRTLV